MYTTLHAFDLSLFYTIYGLSGQAPWIDLLIVFVGTYLIYALLALVAVYALCQLRAGRMQKFWNTVVATLAALVARYGVAEAIRLVYHHARPFTTLGLPHLLSDTSYSFPSGHTIFVFALAAALWRTNRCLAWWLCGFGLLIGLARVAGGVHYPSDIAGGVLLGIATGYIVSAGWSCISRRRSL